MPFYEELLKRRYTIFHDARTSLRKILRKGMLPASSMTTPMTVYCMLRIYSAVILALAMNLSQMKQIVDFFLFCSSQAVEC